jgi:hypothetical protein
MNRSAAGVTMLVLLLGIGSTIYFSRPNPSRTNEIRLSTESPQKTYAVTLSGQSGPPDTLQTELKYTQHEVKASASKNGVPVFDNLSMYSGDGYDEGFKALYPDHRWLSDTELEFGQSGNFTQSQQDEIYISNQTQKSISHLYVRAGKSYIFLLFDLQPNSTRKLNAHLEYWERVIGAKGKFIDGGDIPYTDVGFSSENKNATQAHYCMIIKDTGLQIVSREFDGNKLNGPSVSAADCDLNKY